MHDTFRLALHWQRRLLRLAVGSGAVSSMAAVWPGHVDPENVVLGSALQRTHEELRMELASIAA